MRTLGIDPSPTLQTCAIIDGQEVISFFALPSTPAGLRRLAELARGVDVVGVENVEEQHHAGALHLAPILETAKAVGRVTLALEFEGVEPVMVSRNRHVLQKIFGTSAPSHTTLLKAGLALPVVTQGERAGELKKLTKDLCLDAWLSARWPGWAGVYAAIEVVRRRHGLATAKRSDFFSALAVAWVAQDVDFIESRNALTEANREERKAKKAVVRKLRKSAGKRHAPALPEGFEG